MAASVRMLGSGVCGFFGERLPIVPLADGAGHVLKHGSLMCGGRVNRGKHFREVADFLDALAKPMKVFGIERGKFGSDSCNLRLNFPGNPIFFG